MVSRLRLSVFVGISAASDGCAAAPPHYAARVQFDAVILSGGRSSRLGGEPKAALVLLGHSLLELAVSAAGQARNIVVVGDKPGSSFAPPESQLPLSAPSELSASPASQASPGSTVPAVTFVREEPKFGGPAAAIAAGLSALTAINADHRMPAPEFTLVLACDMPHAAPAIAALVDAAVAAPAGVDGVIARDGSGRDQYLLALYRSDALQAAAAVQQTKGGVDGLSARQLVADLNLVSVRVPSGTTDDIDTWDDARRLGVSHSSLPGASY
jgi:molybdopterin-guanine dinucleotide biosynthesis protein A